MDRYLTASLQSVVCVHYLVSQAVLKTDAAVDSRSMSGFPKRFVNVFPIPRLVVTSELTETTNLKRISLRCRPRFVAVVFVAASSALEVIPYTLAENAGMNPISIVTELRSEHAKGKVGAGESMGAWSSLVVEARLSS